jgi:ketosteroid isomerase-like protein
MTEGHKAAVHAVATQWRDAILAKDWATFARLYTRDAVLMPPNVPLVIGSAAIAA